MRCLLLLVPKTSYRSADYLAAADALGLPVVLGTDRCKALDATGIAPTSRPNLVLDFRNVPASVRAIRAAAQGHGIGAVIGTDDQTTALAAAAAAALGQPHNARAAVGAATDKALLRQTLTAAGVPQAQWTEIEVASDPGAAADHVAQTVGFPAVLKPRGLNASRGVIRADDRGGAAAAFERITSLLAEPLVAKRAGDTATSILAERFLPGAEAALDGLLTGGALQILAVFDKPDALDGPYFEETIYVTPSRLPAPVLATIEAVTARACAALGLVHGPVHAELRVAGNQAFVIEIAARSIGGLCGRTLRFALSGPATGQGHDPARSLEALVIQHALGLAPAAQPAAGAAGVLMIPIPRCGVLREVHGVAEALAIDGVEDVVITAELDRSIRTLPEGEAYLGFAFARGESPAAVEATLRQVQATLQPRIDAALPIFTTDPTGRPSAPLSRTKAR